MVPVDLERLCGADDQFVDHRVHIGLPRSIVIAASVVRAMEFAPTLVWRRGSKNAFATSRSELEEGI